MITERTATPAYKANITELKDVPEGLAFAFVPTELQQARVPGELPKRVPEYIVLVRGSGDSLSFDWGLTPDDPGAAKSALEEEARRRIKERSAWVAQVADLVAKVERWGRELGWDTRRIEKRLDDSYIGTHRLPALLMQEGTCRVLLEPIGRSAPGVDGVVDLYLMPAYDDIASFCFYGGIWNVHYLFPDAGVVDDSRQAPQGLRITASPIYRRPARFLREIRGPGPP
jgi:hypothetical protein